MSFSESRALSVVETPWIDRPQARALFDGIHARANELATIAARLANALATSSGGYVESPPPNQPPHRVWYSECHIHCGDLRVAMNQRPLLFHLFKVLIDSPNQEIGREDLIKAIYPRAGEAGVSEQLKAATAHNLVKLVSRARDIAMNQLSDHDDGYTRWFIYDIRRGLWRLREPAVNI